MRLDKYLKVAKILKRRSVSNTAAKENKILVNGKTAKPAKDIKVGDLLTIRFGNRLMTFEVLNCDLPKGKSEELLYAIKESTYLKEGCSALDQDNTDNDQDSSQAFSK